MCKHNTLTKIHVIRRANPFVTDGWHPIHVDSCIAEELQELNNKGVITTNSCCSHGHNVPSTLIAQESIELAKSLGYDPRPREDDPNLELDYEMHLKTGGFLSPEHNLDQVTKEINYKENLKIIAKNHGLSVRGLIRGISNGTFSLQRVTTD